MAADSGRNNALIIEIGRGVFITSLFFLSIALVPFLSAMLLIMIPLPIAFYFAKLGRSKGLFVLAFSLLVLGAAQQILSAQLSIAAFLILGGLGVIISEMFHRRLTLGWTITVAAVSGFAIMGIIILYSGIVNEKAPAEHIYFYVQAMVKENIRLYGELDLPQEQLQFLKDNAAAISRVLTNIFPALSLVGMAFVSLVNVLVLRTLLGLQGLPFPDYGDLTRWKANDHLIWCLIVSGAGLAVPMDAIRFPALNLLVICLFVYFLQGLAIAEFFFRKKKVPFLVRFLFYFLIMLQQYFMLFIIVAGIFDLWVDFRKISKSSQNLDHSS
jgi:uncharacterized protein YybS (DUF2232 family)